MVGLPKWIQIKNGFLNQRTKQDNSRSKLNTQNPPWWQEPDAPAQKKNDGGNNGPVRYRGVRGVREVFIDKIMLVRRLQLLFCNL